MNDKLRKCPVCAADVCDHDERHMANALSVLGTGVSNLDMILPHRWISSMRSMGRAAIVEMKRSNERLSVGQQIALLDFTGVTEAISGWRMEQRAFAVWNEDRGGVRIFTFQAGEPPLVELASDGTWLGAARAVQEWMRNGTLITRAEMRRSAA